MNTYNTTTIADQTAQASSNEEMVDICNDKGGKFGPHLSKDFLSDPRIMTLSLQALGLLVKLKSFEDTLRPVPAVIDKGMKILSLKKKELEASLSELRDGSDDPLVYIKNGAWHVRPFGAPIKVSVSESRKRAAEIRWQREAEAKEMQRLQDEATAEKKTSKKNKAKEATPDMFDSAFTTPRQALVDLFHLKCPSLNKLDKVKIAEWGQGRKERLGARWQTHPTLEWWTQFFESVEKSDFLTGRANPNFKATFDWIIAPNNFVKIVEGNYSKNRSVRGGLFNPGKDAFAVGSYGGHQVDEDAPWLKD